MLLKDIEELKSFNALSLREMFYQTIDQNQEITSKCKKKV